MKLEIALKLAALALMTLAVERIFSGDIRALLLMLLAAVLVYFSSRQAIRQAG